MIPSSARVVIFQSQTGTSPCSLGSNLLFSQPQEKEAAWVPFWLHAGWVTVQRVFLQTDVTQVWQVSQKGQTGADLQIASLQCQVKICEHCQQAEISWN